MLRIGPYEMFAVDAGRFALDGGAMFGVVPKALWHKHATPDERNRIALALRCLLAIDRQAGRVILVDTGAGEKWTPEEIDRFAFDIAGDPLGRALREHDLADDEVTDVIVTHLHFDHNGGLTRLVGSHDSSPEPRFSKARHWIHAEHLAHALSPTPKDRGSFLERDYLAVREAGLFELLQGDDPPSPFPQFRWLVTHGHTPYQLLPRFVGEDLEVQFCADLFPTSAHLPAAWVMAYDNQPLKTIAEKQSLLQECADRDLALFLEHDPESALIRVDTTGKKPQVRQVMDI